MHLQAEGNITIHIGLSHVNGKLQMYDFPLKNMCNEWPCMLQCIATRFQHLRTIRSICSLARGASFLKQKSIVSMWSFLSDIQNNGFGGANGGFYVFALALEMYLHRIAPIYIFIFFNTWISIYIYIYTCHT